MKTNQTKLIVSSNAACGCQNCGCDCNPVCTCATACACGMAGCQCTEQDGSANSRKS